MKKKVNIAGYFSHDLDFNNKSIDDIFQMIAERLEIIDIKSKANETANIKETVELEKINSNLNNWQISNLDYLANPFKNNYFYLEFIGPDNTKIGVYKDSVKYITNYHYKYWFLSMPFNLLDYEKIKIFKIMAAFNGDSVVFLPEAKYSLSEFADNWGFNSFSGNIIELKKIYGEPQEEHCKMKLPLMYDIYRKETYLIDKMEIYRELLKEEEVTVYEDKEEYYNYYFNNDMLSNKKNLNDEYQHLRFILDDCQKANADEAPNSLSHLLDYRISEFVANSKRGKNLIKLIKKAINENSAFKHCEFLNFISGSYFYDFLGLPEVINFYGKRIWRINASLYVDRLNEKVMSVHIGTIIKDRSTGEVLYNDLKEQSTDSIDLSWIFGN